MGDFYRYYYYQIMSWLTVGQLKEFCQQKAHHYRQTKDKKLPDYLNYEQNRLPGKTVRNGYDFYAEDQQVAAFAILHKLQEQDLKRKAAAGKKIRVCFLIDNITRLTANSVYWHMTKTKIFEPFFLFIDSHDTGIKENDEHYRQYLADLELLRSQGYKTLSGYDENRELIPIDHFHPDIIFLVNRTMDYYAETISNRYLNINYLTCYLNYGFNIANSYNYHYNNCRVAGCWKYFVETRGDYYELLRHSKYYGANAVLSGYPKMDVYKEPLSHCQLPSKIDNGKPIVIYAPHRSIKDQWEPTNLSTFHLYYQYFLDLAKAHPEINFVYKPHPFLEPEIYKHHVMTKEEYAQYLDAWDQLENGIYVRDGEYLDIFRKSDLLITDCGTFIFEWLPTRKPCIYLVNPEREQSRYLDGFTLTTRKILSTYYLCHDQKEIEQQFSNIMDAHQDPQADKRAQVCDEVFVNLGSAGSYIVDYLTNILEDAP